MCHEALTALYEIRYWGLLWQLFDSIGLCLALTGATEAASIVVGNLEAHHPPGGYELRFGLRARTLEIVRSHAEFSEWTARGAALERHEMVEFALAALKHGTKT